MGTAKCHSAYPSLFGETPGSSIACDSSTVGLWWAVPPTWPFCLFKRVDGPSEMMMLTGVATLNWPHISHSRSGLLFL